jgi:uncharacterized protein YegL
MEEIGATRDRSMTKWPIGGITQPKTFNQLGILVLDGSGSMREGQSTAKISLAQSVSQAVRNTFSRFRQSQLVNNFSFAIVYYDDRAKVEVDITEAKHIDDNRSYDPTVGMGGMTSIAAGLKEAKKLADKFLAVQTEGGIQKTVVILVLSDGLDMTQPETVSVVKSLKQNPKITVVSCFFETLGGDADLIQEASAFLQGLSSDPVAGFTKTPDPEKIRTFFIASMSNKKKI